MTFWFITESKQQVGGENEAVFFESNGLPDLTRALSRDHLREWVKQLRAGMHPEKIDDETNYIWQLFSEMHRDDHVVALTENNTLMLGELTGDYRFEPGEQGGRHLWPARWVASDIPITTFPTIKALMGVTRIKELPESESRIQFRKYIPSWQTKGYVLFRWVSIGLLLTELAYFWPRK